MRTLLRASVQLRTGRVAAHARFMSVAAAARKPGASTSDPENNLGLMQLLASKVRRRAHMSPAKNRRDLLVVPVVCAMFFSLSVSTALRKLTTLFSFFTCFAI